MQEAFEYLKDIKNDKAWISANKYASILSSKLRQISLALSVSDLLKQLVVT